MGVGAVKRFSGMRWTVVERISGLDLYPARHRFTWLFARAHHQIREKELGKTGRIFRLYFLGFLRS